MAEERKNRIVLRLTKKIMSDLNIACDPDSFERTYAGRHQKAAGAFSWVMSTKDGFLVGSCWPASECIKKKYILHWGMCGEIVPEEANKA